MEGALHWALRFLERLGRGLVGGKWGGRGSAQLAERHLMPFAAFRGVRFPARC